ncbi:TBC1 domain family member 5 [Cimex lectularius]|uniref:Rab-GAP TBC domain-containing protein n=1 Tax=Cimex lectularius TaxID=79782 RepID=A0A8I6RYI7_CIMLE|nr:TBC1 domain family member 5 [Cimex lectularius]XP_014254880.1 TBC1 domain family member 5 [Cimex lectularius]XP_014254881.1 TBC1 domain family member 5 [Cimex lectularius]XP_014254883.1 TBC1 domain family member 5 [Cimex lectularius]XP_014254884.1 TBC1 domain family member 5 [Cimex lectularius]
MDQPHVGSGLAYEDEWRKVCQLDSKMEKLKKAAKRGGLRCSQFRSVIWKLFLGVLTPGSSPSWPMESADSRERYIKLKTALDVNPYVHSEPDDNPLSQNDKSTWHQYFCDKELKSIIKQDVIRTLFSGVDFFKNEFIQETMINVLFCYARENPTMCYRQGMHEILAPIIYVVHCDHMTLLNNQRYSLVRSDILEIVNPRYLEADSYAIFWRVMDAIKGSYLISNLAPTSTGYFPTVDKGLVKSDNNQVLSQLTWIKNNLLAPIDWELNRHLDNLEIMFPLFGIKWLRLLFGREFPLNDLLILWDSIFAENENFGLVNYIVVSMLVSIRQTLLSEDYSACLKTLMTYPPTGDILCIIQYALHLKNPSQYSIPDKINFQFNPPVVDFTCANNHVNYRRPPIICTAIPKPQPPKLPQNSRNTIEDGYALYDPELLLKELKEVQNTMTLCRAKLLQYHKILEQCASSPDPQIRQALTGILGLSVMLGKHIPKVHWLQPVDQAYEVHEMLVLSPVDTPSSKARKKKPPLVDMTVFSCTVTPFIESDNEDCNRMWKSL